MSKGEAAAAVAVVAAGNDVKPDVSTDQRPRPGECDTEYMSLSGNDVECELEYFGCKETFPLKGRDHHMKEHAHKHLSLLAKAIVKATQEFDEKQLNKEQHITRLEDALENREKDFQEQLRVRDNELTKRERVNDQKFHTFHEALQQKELELQQVQTQLKENDAETKQTIATKDFEIKAALVAAQRRWRNVTTMAVTVLVVISAVAAVFTLAQVNANVAMQQGVFQQSQLKSLPEQFEQKLQKQEQQMQDLQDYDKQVQQQLQEKDAEMTKFKAKCDELKVKVDSNDQQIQNAGKAIEDRSKQFQEQLKMRDSELTKMLQSSGEQTSEVRAEILQKLEEKSDHLKQEITKVDAEMKLEVKLKLKETDQQIQTINQVIQDNERQLQERFNATDSEVIKSKVKENGQQVKTILMSQKELQVKNEQHAAEMTALREQSNASLQKLRKDVYILKAKAGFPEYHFTVYNYYAELIEFRQAWTAIFVTHPKGYAFAIVVDPFGYSLGNQTHLSVSVYSQMGPFDDVLPWPAKVTFTVQLLNQHKGPGPCDHQKTA